MLEAKNCKPGAEQYERFVALGKERIQYDYRAADGELFSTIAPSLAVAKSRRDEWLGRKLDTVAVNTRPQGRRLQVK
jgi:hypothetical protein